MAAPKVINTLDEFRGLLSGSEKRLLEKTDPQSIGTTISYLVGKKELQLAQNGREVTFGTDLISNATQEIAEFYEPEDTFSSEPIHVTNPLGGAVENLGGLQYLPFMNQEESQSRIVREFHEAQHGSLSKTLTDSYEKIHAALPSGTHEDQVNRLTEQLNQLTQNFEVDSSLERDFGAIKSRLSDAGVLSEGMSQELETKYQKLKDFRTKQLKKAEDKFYSKKKNKGKTFTDPNKINTKALAESLLHARSADERASILANFVADRQGRTHDSLQYLFTNPRRGLRGIVGDQSIFNRSQRKALYNKGVDEQKARVKAWKDRKQQQSKSLQKLSKLLRRKRITQEGTVEINDAADRNQEEQASMQENEENSDNSLVDNLNTLWNDLDKARNLARQIENLQGKLPQIFGGGPTTAAGGTATGTAGAGATGVGAAAGGTSAATGFFATPAGWITIAVIVFLFIVLIIMLVIASTNPNANAPETGQKLCPDATPPTAGQMLTVLEQQFNIHVHGSDQGMISHIYSTACTLSQYTFTQLMHIPSLKIDLYIDNPGCSGFTQHQNGGYRVTIHACSNAAGDQFIITHEFAHVIQFENPSLAAQFCSQAYHGAIVKGHCESSSPSTIPTFNCLRDYTHNYDSPNPTECFSDMAGAFLTYKDFHDTLIIKGQIIPTNWQQMDNYPTNFPLYYNFASQNLFLPNNNTSNASQLVSIAQAITSKLTKTFGRSIDLFDQITPNPPGRFTLPNSPNPNYIVMMRGGQACAKDHGCVYSRYWCTDLLIDTYNIALGKRVLGEDLGTVENMIDFWKKPTASGFIFVHYRNASEHQSALSALYATRPILGDALFFESVEGSHNGFEHVALIRDMSLDPSGNGYIKTYEANSGSITGTYPISHWQIKNTPYPVTGFGLYTTGAQASGGL